MLKECREKIRQNKSVLIFFIEIIKYIKAWIKQAKKVRIFFFLRESENNVSG